MARASGAEQTERQTRRSTKAFTAFVSSGAQVLDPYISSSTRSQSGQPNSSGRSQAATPSTVAQPGRPQSRIWTGHIPADNVGFRLLRKAGWSVGSGLGVGEHGRRDPVEPVLPKGTRGLGFDSSATQQHQQRQQQQQNKQHQQGQKRGPGSALDGGGDEAGAGRHQRPTAQQRMAALTREELVRESLPDKVARHRQLMSAEQEQRRGRAIDAFLRSAFNDPFDHLHSDNSNPLARRHQLTDSNPLLNPIED